MTDEAAISLDCLLAHQSFLRALARGLLRDEHLAEDVVQEALLKAVDAPPREAGALTTWLTTVTRRLALQRGSRDRSRALRERRAGEREISSPSPEAIAERSPDAEALTDEEGRFRFDSGDERFSWLIAEKPGWVTAHIMAGAGGLDPGSSIQPITEPILMSRAARVSGTVIDGDGLAVPDATILVHRPRHPGVQPSSPSPDCPHFDLIAEARTGPDGGFRFEGLPECTASIWAVTPETFFCSSEVLDLRSGERVEGVEITLVALEHENTIEGTVVGCPAELLPRLQVRCELEHASVRPPGRAMHRSYTHVDASGRFRLRVPDGSGPIALTTSGLPGEQPAVSLVVEPGAREVVIDLAKASGFRLRLVDEEGEPVTGALVTATAVEERLVVDPDLLAKLREGGPIQDVLDQAKKAPGRLLARAIEESPSAAGLFTVPLPLEEFALTIEAPGFHVLRTEPLDPGEVSEELVLELRRAPGVRGRVLAAGRPVRGARVTIRPVRPEGRLQRWNGFLHRVDTGGGSRVSATETEVDGSFRLELRPDELAGPGRLHSSRQPPRVLLTVESEGLAAAERGPWTVDEETGWDVGTIELESGGSIEGIVLQPGELALEVFATQGNGVLRRCRVDAEGGRYRLDHLAPGRWQVASREAGAWYPYSTPVERGFRETDWSCEVEAGEVTELELNLARPELAGLEGRFLLDGRPVERWSVTLRMEGTGSGSGTVTDLHGSFAYEEIDPGVYTLALHRGGGSAGTATFESRVELLPGENRWERDVETAPVTLTGDRELQLFRWSGPRGLSASIHFSLRDTAPWAPVGTLVDGRDRSFPIARGQVNAIDLGRQPERDGK